MTDKGWTFTKRTVEQYQFNGPHGLWAIITLDERGIFQAVSDLGTYSYEGWGHHGCASFKHFLVKLRDPDYFIGKVMSRGEAQAFAHDRTVREIKRRILECRRAGMPRDAAAKCWEEIERAEYSGDATFFICSVERDHPTLFARLFDHDPCAVSEACCYEYRPWPLRFFHEIFRGQLVPALEAEIAEIGSAS